MTFEKRRILIAFAALCLAKIPPGNASFSLGSLINDLDDLTGDVVTGTGDVAKALLTGAAGLTGALGQQLDNTGTLLQNVATAVASVPQDMSNFTNALGAVGDSLTGLIQSVMNAGDDIGDIGNQILNTSAIISDLENSLQDATNEALGQWSLTLDDLNDRALNATDFGDLFQVLSALDSVGDAVEALAQALALIVNGLAQLLTSAVEDAIDGTLSVEGTSLEDYVGNWEDLTEGFASDLLDALYNAYYTLAPQYLVQDPTQVKFFLYPNAKNASVRVPLQWTRNGLTSAGYKTSLPVIIIVEGLVTPENPSGGSDVIVQAYTTANVTAKKANVVVVEYSNVTGTFTLNWPGYLSAFGQYAHDTYNANFVAGILSNFFVFLSNTTILPTSTSKFMQFTTDGYANAHCVGASIGAHICGIAAQLYTTAWNKQILRISAADAAGPLFSSAPSGDCLAPNQAKYTDAIYTNRDGFGMPDGQNVATANVDINGGYVQSKLCGTQDLNYPCSHDAASQDFATTIGTKIPATCEAGGHCSTPAISSIGEQIPLTTVGNYNAIM